MICSKQTNVGPGSAFCIPTSKVVELGTICKGIVAVLNRKSKDVGVVRSAGTFRGVWEEEPRTAPKKDVNNWTKWCSTHEMFRDDCLIVTIIYMGGKRCRSCVLNKGSTDMNISDAKTNRDPGCNDKASVISCGFCGFENGTARVSVLVNTNGTVISLVTRNERLMRPEPTELSTLIAQE